MLGLLGALDPHKHKLNLGLITESEAAVSKSDHTKSEKESNNQGSVVSLNVFIPVG